MKVGIFYHEKKVSPDTLDRLRTLLAGMGTFCVFFSREEEIGGVDRLIVLGGDGGVLRAARRSSLLNIPLVGINYGTLGFLTEFERGEEEQAARLVTEERCLILRRSMLEVWVRGKQHCCLNELTLLRRIAPDAEDGVVCIRVNMDGSPAGEFLADGLIIATPTGSTAYSLSAGGSILTPDCPALILTPVNAFSLRSRPIVCSDTSVLSFTVPEGRVELHGDGKFLGELSAGEEITVKKSDRCALFLTRGKRDFFRRLTEKIN